MGKYPDIVRSVAEPVKPEPDGTDEKSRETSALLEAGWTPKMRCGKCIWESPDQRAWYSQEMAFHLLKRGVGPGGRVRRGSEPYRSEEPDQLLGREDE